MNKIVLFLAALFVTEAAAAVDYKDITTAAYCVGAIRTNIDLATRDFPTVDQRSEKQNLALKVAIVRGALVQKIIDLETVKQLSSVGSRDAQLCWEASTKCTSQIKTPLPDTNSLEWKVCMAGAQPACDRIVPCDRP
jgi:hypothetical protein